MHGGLEVSTLSKGCVPAPIFSMRTNSGLCCWANRVHHTHLFHGSVAFAGVLRVSKTAHQTTVPRFAGINKVQINDETLNTCAFACLWCPVKPILLETTSDSASLTRAAEKLLEKDSSHSIQLNTQAFLTQNLWSNSKEIWLCGI